MKKGILFIAALIFTICLVGGCKKSSSNYTINPAMSATIGSYTFNAESVEPATVTPQLVDTQTTLLVTGFDPTTGDKIILSVIKYKNEDGTFSIVAGQAAAVYYHAGVYDPATGGIVAINNVSNVITGYFSFTTPDGNNATNGTFTVGNPWVY